MLTLADIKPHSDMVLVERIEDAPGLIVSPDLTCTRDGRWVNRSPVGIRRGRVVAVGDGDRFIWSKKDPGKAIGLANKDGSPAAMQVAPGDEVLYTRAPANDVYIEGRPYVFLHEEQHIYAVVER